jgi:hypothetical protein
MATFHIQVEGLTGLDIDGSSSPTQDELTQFLRDGVIDVTNKTIASTPSELFNFQRSTSSDSQGVSVGGATIISVLREANADGSSDGSTAWRECRQIPASLQSRVVDINSLQYASKFNPVYVLENSNTINVYPVPSSNNAIKVYYVNEEPRDITNNANLNHSHENIKYFPNDKVYLVVVYASIKALENAMSAKGIPVVASDSTGVELTSVTQLDGENTVDDFDGNAIEVDQWWSTAAHLIEGEEDPELAISHVQKIQTYIQAYTAQLQGNSQDYAWMQARHEILLAQYIRAFSVSQPQEGAE